MFAIQYGLLISFALSSITGISGVASTGTTMQRFFGDSYPTAPIFFWNFRMQFGSLLVVYLLNVFVALYIPLTKLAYILASMNLMRVAYVMQYVVNAEKLALMGFLENGKMLKIICIVQGVLASVIAGCAYVSSSNAEYIAFVATLTPAEELGPYKYFVYVLCTIGVLGRIPQLINPIQGAERFMAEGKSLPSDKGEQTMLEFAVGFTALNYITIWAFVLGLTFVVPDVTPIALFMAIVCGTFVLFMAKTIKEIDDYGFNIRPMLFFLVLISVMFGASVLALAA